MPIPTTQASKVPIYDSTSLKTTTDDFLPPYLTSLPKPYTFTQIHTYTNIRLALGYSAVLIAAALFAFDYRFGWAASKPYTLPACIVYFLLNSTLSLWIWRVEQGCVFQGVRAGGQRLTLRSQGKKASPSYKLKVVYEAAGGQVWDDKTIEGRFTEWFDRDGWLQQEALRGWLRRNVEVLDLAEKERASVEGVGSKSEKQVVEVSGSDIFETRSTSTEAKTVAVDAATTASGKKGKARKKA